MPLDQKISIPLSVDEWLLVLATVGNTKLSFEDLEPFLKLQSRIALAFARSLAQKLVASPAATEGEKPEVEHGR
jgi:hypothetical protein